MDDDAAQALIRRATVRLLCVGTYEPDPRDPVAVADHRTSMCDLHAALSLARGFAPDELDPASGVQTLASLYARRFGTRDVARHRS